MDFRDFCDRSLDLREHLAGKQQMGLDDDASKWQCSGSTQAIGQIGLGNGGKANISPADRCLLYSQTRKALISASASG